MGYNILDMFFQLDLSLMEILFVYMVNMSQKERFNLAAHIPSLQLLIGLPNSGKGRAKGHVLVSSPWNGLSEGLDGVFSLQRSLEIPSRIYFRYFVLCNYFLPRYELTANPFVYVIQERKDGIVL